MVQVLSSGSSLASSFLANAGEMKAGRPKHKAYRKFIFLLALAMLSPLLLAQSNPQVTGVDPASGKVNDDITIAGENLGKTTVVAVYLSDDKMDYKATIVDQSADKIVLKVPQVKAGTYNISVQVGTNILIKPVKFTVQE